MMLDRLSACALRKGLIVNTSKSEVVHLNSRRTRVPVFTLGGLQLANKDSFKHLGMVFTKTHNMAAAAEHMLTPFMAGCRRIRQFALEHRLKIDHTACFGSLKDMHFQQACMQVKYGALST